MPRHGGRLRHRGQLWTGALIGCVLAAAAIVTVPARGAVVACGTLITSSITLSSNVGPCPSGGITVQGSNLTIDLNGHRIFGTPTTGDGVGIRLNGASDVVIKNGTVTSFDAGIVIAGGAGNRVTQIKAIGNIGDADGTTLGDGILIDGSRSNIVRGNEVRANGPFSGISVISNGSVGNKISKNTIQDNDIASAGSNNDVGVRLEPNTRETTLKRNVIAFSGLDGISIFQSSRANVVIENTIKFNGFHDELHRKGDGIRVFGSAGPEENVIRENSILDNAAFGLILSEEATANHVEKNKASRNGFHAPGATDLADENEGCDANVWLNNSGTANRNCVQ
jgi:hypothetical protein